MRLTLHRYLDTGKSTAGLLFLDGEFACHTLENPWKNNERRVSCIPEGTYRLGLRTEGGWDERAGKKFPAMHKGMIELQDVPDRTFILMHWGNYPKDTEGCILLGKTAGVDMVGSSVETYEKVYPKIADAILCGEASIEVGHA